MGLDIQYITHRHIHDPCTFAGRLWSFKFLNMNMHFMFNLDCPSTWLHDLAL